MGNMVYGQANAMPSTPKKDTSLNKTNNSSWKNEDAAVYYELLNSDVHYVPDSTVHAFERLKYLETWSRDLGNLGGPTTNLMFTPHNNVGPTMGYHVFDAYAYSIDSVKYYNTNRPYSDFYYRLGSKLEQLVGLMHAQNIRPNWNFAVEYRKVNSAGQYKIGRSNNDNLELSSNYKSLDKHYKLYFGLVYNKEQHDENGGVVDSELMMMSNGQAVYSDRKTIDAVNQNDYYSLTRSGVYNIDRQFSVRLQHAYSWGTTDTSYNADSTQFSFKLTPRFSISHRFDVGSEKHTYNDLTPDSIRYAGLFNQGFGNVGYYYAGQDSVFVQQKWIWVDNLIMFNGFIGQEGHQARFGLGWGSRYDQFIALPGYNEVQSVSNLFHNYLEGKLIKEALSAGAWSYGADAKIYFTGQDAGNFDLVAKIGKELPKVGSFSAGFSQQLGSVPYSYSLYENAYTKHNFADSFMGAKESITRLFATIESHKYRFSTGLNDYTLNNYYYINTAFLPARYNIPFNILQVWGRKVFKMGNFYLDNQIVFQQQPAGAPINVPTFMGRHDISYERSMFKKALKSAVGFGIRYNTAYKPAGYDYLLNQFYYQNNETISNAPEVSFFFNFKVKKHFRAFLMVDQLQQVIPGMTNTVIFVGMPVAGWGKLPDYAAPNAMLRFGFNWVLVN